MPINKPPYILSEVAKKDLENIFDYSLTKFGLDQAVSYVTSFDNIFTSLAKNVNMGYSRNELQNNLRSFAYKSHVIFYTKINTSIRVIRILHSSRDLPKNF